MADVNLVTHRDSLKNALFKQDATTFNMANQWGRVPEHFLQTRYLTPTVTAPATGGTTEVTLARWGPFLTRPVLEFKSQVGNNLRHVFGAGFLAIEYIEVYSNGAFVSRRYGWQMLREYLLHFTDEERLGWDAQVGCVPDTVTNTAYGAAPITIAGQAGPGVLSAAGLESNIDGASDTVRFRVPLVSSFFWQYIVPMPLLDDGTIKLVIKFAEPRDFISPTNSTTSAALAATLSAVRLECSYILAHSNVQEQLIEDYRRNDREFHYLVLDHAPEIQDLSSITATEYTLDVNSAKDKDIAYMTFGLVAQAGAIGDGSGASANEDLIDNIISSNTVTGGSGNTALRRHPHAYMSCIKQFAIYGSQERLTGRDDVTADRWFNEIMREKFSGRVLENCYWNYAGASTSASANIGAGHPSLLHGWAWSTDATAAQYNSLNSFDFTQVSDPQIKFTTFAALNATAANTATVSSVRVFIDVAYYNVYRIRGFQLEKLK